MNQQSEATDGAAIPSSNISFDDYINRRSQEVSEPEAPAAEPEDESWEEMEESLEPEAVSDEPEESDEEVTEEEEEEEQEIDLLSPSSLLLKDIKDGNFKMS